MQINLCFFSPRFSGKFIYIFFCVRYSKLKHSFKTLSKFSFAFVFLCQHYENSLFATFYLPTFQFHHLIIIVRWCTLVMKIFINPKCKCNHHKFLSQSENQMRARFFLSYSFFSLSLLSFTRRFKRDECSCLARACCTRSHCCNSLCCRLHRPGDYISETFA